MRAWLKFEQAQGRDLPIYPHGHSIFNTIAKYSRPLAYLKGSGEAREMGARQYPVLLADDSDDDRLLLRRAFRAVAGLQLVAEVANGEEAIAYLKGHGKYADRTLYPLPELMLLDLKMPRVTGFEVLEWLQQNKFDPMKVVVLSGSTDPCDIRKALQLGADYYQSKPSDEKTRVELLQLLETSLRMFGQA